MPARQVETADDFLDLAGPFLAARQAEHNLARGLLYARIGYEPVADWDQWSFQPPALQD